MRNVFRFATVLPATLALMLTTVSGCSRSHADSFGISYDECVLKNAVRGGDDDSRSNAQVICSRHFQRAPTESEAGMVSGRAMVVEGSHTASPSASTTADPLQDAFEGYKSQLGRDDSIHADVVNKLDDAVVKSVAVDVDFFDGPPDANGDFTTRKRIKHLHWKLPADIDPGSSENLSGVFEDGRAPSRYYLANFVVDTVLPRTGQEQKSHLLERN